MDIQNQSSQDQVQNAGSVPPPNVATAMPQPSGAASDVKQKLRSLLGRTNKAVAYTPPKSGAVKISKQVPWWPIVIILSVIMLAGAAWESVSTLTITSTPDADSITVGGNSVTAGQKLYRIPGTVSVVIEKNGYITYDKDIELKIGTDVTLHPELKEYPSATVLSYDTAAPITLDTDLQGVKLLSTTKQYIKHITFAGGTVTSQNINIDAIQNLNTFLMPADQSFAVVKKDSEVDVLDFSKTEVTSQETSTFDDNISSVALSPEGDEVFYEQYDTDTSQNYLIRDNITHTSPDRYFDQAMMTELGLTSPELKWSPNNKTVMAIEDQIVIIDLLNRLAYKVTTDSNIADAWFMEGSSTIVAATVDGELIYFDSSQVSANSSQDANPPSASSSWVSQAYAADTTDTGTDNSFTINSCGIYVRPETVTTFASDGVMAMTTDGKLVMYDLIAGTATEFLLDNNIDASTITAMLVDDTNTILYFLSDNTLYSQPLIASKY